MKLIDGLLELNKLNEEIHTVCPIVHIFNSERIKKEEEDIRKRFEQNEKAVVKYEELSNKVYEKMATNYVTVEDRKVSLLVLADIIGLVNLNGNVQEFFDDEEEPAPVFHPRLRHLRSYDVRDSIEIFDSQFCEGSVLVDPFSCKDRDENVMNTYKVKAKSAFFKAICDIDM